MASMPLPPAHNKVAVALAEEVRLCYDDPERFVMKAYPWGEPGTALANYRGPDRWQLQALREVRRQVRLHRFDGFTPVMPIRIAVPSGHGTGKGAFAAWIVDWIMSTRPESKGSVTANTAKQLATKTWAAIQWWTKLCATASWFDMTSEMMWFKTMKEAWAVTALTCAPENAEAFQGQHAPKGSSFYIFDECSNIAKPIWEAAEGGLTDGEPMFFAFGQPTRADGEFYEIIAGGKRERWTQFPIDSRDSKLTNKQIIQEWLDDYGEDSDFFRVRVRGLPPKAGDLQFISADDIMASMKRPLPPPVGTEQLVFGIDYARGGEDQTVIAYRKGLDSRSLASYCISGDKSRDSMLVAVKIADLIDRFKPAAVFADATGGSIGGPINDRLRQLGYNVIDVCYANESPDPRYANVRAYIWARMRDWLKLGCIRNSDRQLQHELGLPSARHDRHNRVVLESKEQIKKRGEGSPDRADALANTFFAAIAAPDPRPAPPAPKRAGSWMS